jgi:hypothetical protein
MHGLTGGRWRSDQIDQPAAYPTRAPQSAAGQATPNHTGAAAGCRRCADPTPTPAIERTRSSSRRAAAGSPTRRPGLVAGPGAAGWRAVRAWRRDAARRGCLPCMACAAWVSLAEWDLLRGACSGAPAGPTAVAPSRPPAGSRAASKRDPPRLTLLSLGRRWPMRPRPASTSPRRVECPPCAGRIEGEVTRRVRGFLPWPSHPSPALPGCACHSGVARAGGWQAPSSGDEWWPAGSTNGEGPTPPTSTKDRLLTPAVISTRACRQNASPTGRPLPADLL